MVDNDQHALVLVQGHLVTGNAGAVGKLATLCVKEIRESSCTNTERTNGFENWRLSHKNATHRRAELKQVG